MLLRHVQHKAIDIVAYQRLLIQCKAPVYFHAHWLNIVAPDWEVLTDENYTKAFVLPIKVKFGIRYLVQPILTQQLGWLSVNDDYVTFETEIFDFLHACYPKIALSINCLPSHKIDAKFVITKRPNHLLTLNCDVTQLLSSFSVNHRRNIKKAIKNNLSIAESTAQENNAFFNIHLAQAKSLKTKNLTKIFLTLAQDPALVGGFKHCKVIDCNNATLAIGTFVHFENQILYLLGASSVYGKSLGASHFMFLKVIEENAFSGKYIDFEGSINSSLSRFYKGFGAIETPYWKVVKRGLLHKLSR